MNTFLSSNEGKYRVARTIVQGIIGVLITYLDVIVGYLLIPDPLRPIVVALIMVILSPIMKAMGKDEIPIQQGYNIDTEGILEDAEVIDDDYDCQN